MKSIPYSKIQDKDRVTPEKNQHNQSEKEKLTVLNSPDKLFPAFDAPERYSTIASATANLICTSLDGTILTIPFIFSKLGVVVAPLIIILYAITSMYTLEVICISARKLGAKSYSGIIEIVGGLSMRILFTSLLLIDVVAVIVGFLILLRQIGSDIGEFIAGVVGSTDTLPSGYILLIGIAVSFPLMLFRDLYKLRYTCYIACFLVICLLANLLTLLCFKASYFKSMTSHNISHHIKYYPSHFTDVLEALPLISVLFMSHFNIMDVFDELHEPTRVRTLRMITRAVLALTLYFVALGFVGYFLLLSQPLYYAPDNILLLFPAMDMRMLPGRVALAVTIICTIPVMMVPAREFIRSLCSHIVEAMSKAGGWYEDEDTDNGNTQHPQYELSFSHYSQWREHDPTRGTKRKKGVTKKQQQRRQNQDPKSSNQSTSKYYQKDASDAYLKDNRAYQQETGQSSSSDGDTSTGNSDGEGDMQSGQQQNKGKISQKEQYLMQQFKRQQSDTQSDSGWLSKRNIIDFFLTLLVIAVALVIAEVVPDEVSIVWQIAGSLAVIPVTVFIPALFYILLTKQLNAQSDFYTRISIITVLISGPLLLLCGVWNIARLVM